MLATTTIKRQKEIPKKLLQDILHEDDNRLSVLNARYNPITGEDAPGLRFELQISDFLEGQTLYLPVEMMMEPFICALMNCGSFDLYIARYLPEGGDYQSYRESVIRYFIRLRCKYDFYFFAYAYGRIKNKEGGSDIPFYLRPAQVKLCKIFEQMRLSNQAILVILLKCRQWGGSTLTDIYMAWIQIFWKTNWNSNIVGHMSTSASNVFAMYEKLIDAIPLWLFYDLGEEYPAEVKKFAGVGTTQNIKEMVPRHCKIQTGSALNPESTRSADAAMVHLTEEAFFPETEKRMPAQIASASFSSVNTELPYTFIVRESTPNGKNHYYDEWMKTKKVNPKTGERLSAYIGVFVAWFEIETYMSPFKDEDERADFIIELWRNRNDKQYHGAYLWSLWEKGASLEGIKWYKNKLKTMASLEEMQQEYPSDDIEAFRFSGNQVFDMYKVEAMTEDCFAPIFEGDIEGDSVLPDVPPEEAGFVTPKCMQNVRLVEQAGGPLRVWEFPDDTERVENRYIVSVDIGGSHKTSDYYDMVVIDRYDMMYGGTEAIVAEWHGHSDPDQIAMRSAQLAHFYNDALLVVENNTAYSKMNNTDGDVAELFFPILRPLYENIYSSNYSKLLKHRQKETKLGFNTNRNNKPAIIKLLVKLVRTHDYIEHENEALTEMSYYLFTDKGTYEAAPGYHDDRVMARAIGLWVSRMDMDTPYIPVEVSEDDAQRQERRRIAEHTNTILGNLK